MHITVIGTGFVGVVSAAVYASFDHQVIGLDIDEVKVASLRQGKVPFFEPNLENLLLAQQKKGNLRFTTSYQEAIREAEVVIIAVGTPSAADETADLKYVFASAESMAPYLRDNTIVAIKSTVPPTTLERTLEVIAQHSSAKVYGASLPEFLREGSAVHDTLHPDRIVIGADNAFVRQTLAQLHEPLNAPIVHCSVASAQMAKYTANAYLATRITFINEIANLCEKNGADINQVIEAIGRDKRIGPHYWYPGLGYGGSCFPKDVKELAAYSRSIGEDGNLLNQVNNINKQRMSRLLARFAEFVGGFAGKRVAVLGIAFKPNTDDTREAPALRIIPALVAAGATVTSFDPMASYPGELTGHRQADSLLSACQDADAIMTLVEWPEINHFDFSRVRSSDRPQHFLDCRNQFDPDILKQLGYQYLGIGRS